MKLFPTIILLLSFSTLFSQENNVYLTGGSVLLAGTVSLNYERRIETFQNGNQVLIKAGIGSFRSIFSDVTNRSRSRYFSLAGVFLLGGNEHYLESNIGGFGRRTNLIGIFPVLPYLALGYRKQSKKMLFRVGVSFPEMIYLSLGFRF